MTNEQFDNLRLSQKVTFAESEAARYILVLEGTIDEAIVMYGRYGIDKVRLQDVLKLFNTAK